MTTKFIVVTAPSANGMFIAQAVSVLSNNTLGGVITTSEPQPTRAAAKARLLGALDDSYTRVPSAGCWKLWRLE